MMVNLRLLQRLALFFVAATTGRSVLAEAAAEDSSSCSSSSEDAATCAASAKQTTVTVYPNGGGTLKNSKVVPIDELDTSRSYYTEEGVKINDISKITADNITNVFEGPSKAGTNFIYPVLEIGRRITTAVQSPSTGKPIVIEALSESPRIFYVSDFMTPAEADILMEYATSEENPYKMAQSTGGTHKSWAEGGRKDVLKTRTSMNAFDISTPTSYTIKRRAFELLRIPVYDESMADGIQVLRYELGQAYVAHHDYFPEQQSDDHNWDPSQGGSNRFATVFLYLSDVEAGGQTCFPYVDRVKEPKELAERLHGSEAPLSEADLTALIKQANLKEGSWEAKLTRDCYTKFSIKPRKGDALLFYSQTADGKLDPSSLHGAGPVLKGTKWGANLWVWNACRYSMCKTPLEPTKDLLFSY